MGVCRQCGGIVVGPYQPIGYAGKVCMCNWNKPSGWSCPKCGRVNSPQTQTCPCYTNKAES